ncbi:MAG: hypothetical protein DI539_27790 [Flavobacterium psychrophilum]|nr:MAG: hypothetical protein DI539_27790 [Flavobacterium psychrophilum]
MKPIIAYILVFTLLATFLNSCGDGKFDYEKWSKVENTNYPPKARKNMIADVLQNEIRKGMNTSDVLKLLGGPDYSNDSLIIYNIEIEYSSGVDPELTRDLVIHFKSDSIVTSFELREIKD